MNSNGNKLTDEQLADLLAPGADLREDAELKDLKAALGNYRSETLLWAERRSAVQPSLVPAARRDRLWAAVPQWSLAAVALITVATGIVHFIGNHADSDVTVSAPIAKVTPAPTVRSNQSDIAADNRLLSSIDQALSYRTVSPVDEFDLKPEATRAKRTNNPGVED